MTSQSSEQLKHIAGSEQQDVRSNLGRSPVWYILVYDGTL